MIKDYKLFKEKYNYLKFGNFDNKPLPKSEQELSYDKKLGLKVMKIYDNIFGTNVLATYGSDFDLLVKDPSIKRATSGDVVKALIGKSYKPQFYSKFKFEDKPEDTVENILAKQILNKYQSETISWDSLIKYVYSAKNIHSNERKKSFVYKLFYNFGKEFDQNIAKEVFEIKNKKFKYDVKDDRKDIVMDSKLEKLFWKCIKWSLAHYKDWMKTKDVLEKAGDKLVELVTDKSDIINKLIDEKVALFEEEVKKVI
jgi:hypothetical protein